MMNTSIRSSSIPSIFDSHWQTLLWREWRNCDDAEYACHLFELLRHEPVNRQAIVILGLLGALAGGLAGWWLTLLFTGGENLIIGIVVFLGAGVGGLAAAGLGLTQRPHWGVWLQRLLPDTLKVDSTPQNFEILAKMIGLSPAFFNLMQFRLPAVLMSSLGVSITGMLFFDQSEPTFLLTLGIIGAILVGGWGYAGPFWLLRLLLSLLLGLAFGLFFGLGFAQILGQLIGPFDVAGSARWVGLGVGLGAGLYFGRGAGLLCTLVWQGILMGVVLITGANLILVGWLAGFLLGSSLGSLSRVWGFSADRLTFAEAYSCRTWYLWWLSRPPASEVETALRRHASGEVWLQALYCLDEQLPHQEAVEVMPVNGKKSSSRRPKSLHHEPASAEAVWAYLQRPDWMDRFVGRHTLATLGGEAVPYLLTQIGTHPLHDTASWLVRSVSYETTQRLANQVEHLICPFCLTRCGPHPIKRPGISVTYYGCRTCGQSRYFLSCPQGVGAVLDKGWKKEHSYQDGLLRINWLVRRSLFDFDWVEIIQATDEEIERFAVQVGNDMDPIRQGRYTQIPCLIVPKCHPSENTLRILERTFAPIGEPSMEQKVPR